MTFRQLLVPTDFSLASENAFALAVEISKEPSATIHLLHDIDVPTETITGANLVREEIRQQEEESRRGMAKLLSSVQAQNVQIWQEIRKSTNPVRSILVYAEESNIDLIVMGTHGRDNVMEQVLGSTAERVIKEAPCPVVTTRGLVARSPERIRRIALPVDFSEHSARLLRFVSDLSSTYDARMVLLHPEAHEPEDEAMDRLRAFYRDSGGTDNDVEMVISPLSPEEAIRSLSQDSTLDLIVMSTHGHRGIMRIFHPDIWDNVVRTADCPVMTIRAPLLD